MPKNYWEKRMKKELEEEQAKLEYEIKIAVKKKLEKIEESVNPDTSQEDIHD